MAELYFIPDKKDYTWYKSQKTKYLFQGRFFHKLHAGSSTWLRWGEYAVKTDILCQYLKIPPIPFYGRELEEIVYPIINRIGQCDFMIVLKRANRFYKKRYYW